MRAGQAVEEKYGESPPTRNATAAVTPPLVSFQPFIEIFPGHGLPWAGLTSFAHIRPPLDGDWGNSGIKNTLGDQLAGAGNMTLASPNSSHADLLHTSFGCLVSERPALLIHDCHGSTAAKMCECV